jgi:hypothetical protein
MRSRFLAIPFALLLTLATAGLAAADTTPGGGGTEGGLDVAVTSASINARTGQVTVTGEVTCEADFDYVSAYVDLSQLVGRLFTVRGSGYVDPGGCAAADGSVSFTISFYADSGKFAPGRAQIRVEAYGEGGCFEDPETGDYYCETFGWASHGPDSILIGRAR